MDPVESESARVMNMLAAFIDEALNGANVPKDKKRWGFTLLCFKFGDNVRTNYVSSAIRKDMIETMKAVIARFEADGKTLQ